MAKNAKGTVLNIGAVAVGDLTNIGGLALSKDTLESTTHDSADGHREFIGGLKDAGEVSLEGFLDTSDAGQVAMKAAFDSDDNSDFTIVFPTSLAASWAFNGVVTAFETGEPMDGLVSFAATIKVSGKPTLNITASTGLTTAFFAISNSAVITPAPANAVYTYTASVLTGVTSVTVTPTATAGVITVNGNVVATGQASSAIALGAAGTVTTITIVVTETGKIPKTYTIYLARAAS